MDLVLLCLFVVTFASILILPGPNAAFAVGQSLKYGVLRSMPVSMGFMCASAAHALLVLSGVAAISREYDFVLLFLKWAGIIYLLFLCYKAFTSTSSGIDINSKTASKTRMFLSAMFVSLTNPKALLASLMVYPAFINPDLAYLPQAISLSIAAMIISFLVYSFYIILASRVKRTMSSSKLEARIVGGSYLCAAGVLATN